MNVLKSLVDKFGKADISKIPVEKLEMEHMKIETELENIENKLDKLDEEKKELFKQGIGASKLKKMRLAAKIAAIEHKQQLLLLQWQELYNAYAMLDIMIATKFDTTLNLEVWSEIKNALLEGKGTDYVFDSLLNKINENTTIWKTIKFHRDLLKKIMSKSGVMAEQGDILKLWDSVEAKEISPEKIEEELSYGKLLEKEESA